MNQANFKKQVRNAALVLSIALAPNAYADDLFDDSFLGEPAPVAPAPAPTPAPAPGADQPLMPETPAPAEGMNVPPPAEEAAPALPDIGSAAPTLPPEAADVPPPPPPAPEPSLSLDMPAPSDVPMPAPSLDIPPPPSASPKGLSLSTPPNEQFLGKLSSDVFREMAEMERENNTLMLQLKQEQLRSEIDALKSAKRQTLFDEIERREKMTQARLEWELAQELKRQEALERRQRAEIRQKQIEAALKREEDRRIQKAKDEEAERQRKEAEIKAKQEKERAELKLKYDAASLIQLNELKPTLMAVTRPPKIKRTPSSRVPSELTAIGEDLLTRKKAGQALTISGGAPTEEKEAKEVAQPATMLYEVSEIRGTAGTLIAKLFYKTDKTTLYVKKATILPTGHTVIDIDKDFVLVQRGNRKEMIGFPAAGLLTESAAQGSDSAQPSEAPQIGQARRPSFGGAGASKAVAGGGGPRFSGASLAK